MKQFWIVFSCFLLLGCFSIQAAAGTSSKASSSKVLKYDMAECIRRGLAANAGVAKAKEMVNEADADMKSKRGDLFPKLSASYTAKRLDNSGLEDSDVDFSSQNSNVASLSATQTLFQGGAIVNSYRRAQIYKDANVLNLQQERIDLVANIQITFYNLLRSREDIRIVNDGIARLEKQYEAAKAFYDVGMITKQEVLQVEVNLALAQKDLVIVKNRVKKYHVQLCMFLNIPPLTDVQFVGKLDQLVAPLSFSLEECIRLALDRRVDLEGGQKQVELARKDAQIIFSRFFPKVSVNFTVVKQQIDYDDANYSDVDRDYWSLGMTASMSLFEGGRDYYEFRRYKHLESEKRYALEDLRNQAASEVTTNYLSVSEALELIRTSKIALHSAQENYKAAEVNYSLQIGTITDVLNAQAKLTEAEAGLNQARADHQIALAKLYHSLGTSVDIF